jgi:Uma2 family endonuclease
MSPTNTAQAPATPLMTAAEFWDYCQLPENRNRWLELHRGKVVEMCRSTRKHGIVASNVSFELQTYSRRTGTGYIATNDSGVILEEDPDTVVGPDVAFYTDATNFADVHPKWGEEPPLVAVEVLSPNDKPSKVNEKVRDYLKNGVRLVWLVDPEEEKVTTYSATRPLELLDIHSELTGEDVLPGFMCKVSDLFRLPMNFASLPPSSSPSP